MTSLRAVLPLALVTASVAVAPAVASTQPAEPAGSAPVAHASGSGAPPPLPAIVNVRVVRAQNLLLHAAKYEDLGDAAKAVAALTAARSNMTKAWAGAKYLIDNAPPPAAPASVPRAKAIPKAKAPAKTKRRSIPIVTARSSGAPVGAAVYADQYTTAAAVISLQHAVATTAMGMMDNAAEPLLTAVSKNLFGALNARDAAIAYIHSIAPVAAPASVLAHASGGAIVGTWDTVMPSVVPDIDDELQQIAGIRGTIKLSPGRARLLNDAELQDRRSESTLNTYWPPVPAG